MQLEWFGLKTTIEDAFESESSEATDLVSVKRFLLELGYRKVEVGAKQLTGIRGRKFWNYCNVGDPRRNFHRTNITTDENGVRVVTVIDTLFTFGSDADRGVYRSEIEMLKQFLATGQINYLPLEEAQALRRSSDLKGTLVVIGATLLIPLYLLLSFLFNLFLSTALLQGI